MILKRYVSSVNNQDRNILILHRLSFATGSNGGAFIGMLELGVY